MQTPTEEEFRKIITDEVENLLAPVKEKQEEMATAVIGLEASIGRIEGEVIKIDDDVKDLKEESVDLKEMKALLLQVEGGLKVVKYIFGIVFLPGSITFFLKLAEWINLFKGAVE